MTSGKWWRLGTVGVVVGLIGACQPGGEQPAGGAAPPAPPAAGAPEEARGDGDLALSVHAQGATAMAQRMATAYEARAREALKKKDLRTAYLAYKRLLPYRPNDPALALALERIAAHIGARAIGALADAEAAELEQVLPALKEADPPRAHVYRTAEANLMVRKGRADEAIVAYRAVLDNTPDYVPALENLALAWSRQNKNDKAIESLRKAIELDPDSPSLHNSLGAVLVSTNDLDGAVEEFRAATKGNTSALAFLNLGEVLARKEDPDGAQKAYDRATQLDPANWEGFERLGSVLLAKEDYEGANAALSRAYELRQNGDVAYKLAMSLLGLKQLDRALDIFMRLLRENPDVPDVLVRVGEIREQRGEIAVALQAYKRALQLLASNKDTAQAADAVATRIRQLESAGGGGGDGVPAQLRGPAPGAGQGAPPGAQPPGDGAQPQQPPSRPPEAPPQHQPPGQGQPQPGQGQPQPGPGQPPPGQGQPQATP